MDHHPVVQQSRAAGRGTWWVSSPKISEKADPKLFPARRCLRSFVLFAPGQLAWFLIDLFRVVLKRRKAGSHRPPLDC